MRLVLMTSLTMIAFAANSILTRMAVDGGMIDPSSFAVIRVLSGAVVLIAVLLLRQRQLPDLRRARFIGAISLAIYMLGFSLAYLTLDAGLGALILFGVVQMSMFAQGALTGAGPSPRQLVGAGVAFGGLLLALWPGPGGQADAAGAFFMALAGVGWAAYSISGRHARDPLATTAVNFLFCLPLVALLLLVGPREFSTMGVWLAVLCGGVTSGLGYAVWYMVLPQLQQGSAAVVQLSVPVIAILGGAVILGEPVTLVVIAAAVLVLGGIALAVTSRSLPAGRS